MTGTPCKRAAHQSTAMADRQSTCEMGDLFVVDRRLDVDLVDQVTQAGAQDDPCSEVCLSQCLWIAATAVSIFSYR